MFANYPDGTTRAFLTVFASQDICKDCQSGKEKLLLTVTHNSGLIQSLSSIFAVTLTRANTRLGGENVLHFF